MSLYKKVRNLKLHNHNIVIIGNINSKNNIYLRDGREVMHNHSLIASKKTNPQHQSREKNKLHRENLDNRNYSIEHISQSYLQDVKRNQTFKKLEELHEPPPKELDKKKKKKTDKKHLPSTKNQKGSKGKKGGFFKPEEVFKTRNSMVSMR